MVDSRNPNGIIAAGDDLEKDDLEKGEVLDSQEEQDLEEGEAHEIDEGDFEKRQRELHQAEDFELLQPLLSAEEAAHHGLATASKPLVAVEKVIVSLIVISFVLVEAYFVGRSFREWHSNEHLHHDGQVINGTEFLPSGLPLEHPFPAPIHRGKENVVLPPKPFEDFLEGRLNSGSGEGLLGRKGLFDTATAKEKMFNVPGVVDGGKPELLVVPQTEEQAPISEDDDGRS